MASLTQLNLARLSWFTGIQIQCSLPPLGTSFEGARGLFPNDSGHSIFRLLLSSGHNVIGAHTVSLGSCTRESAKGGTFVPQPPRFIWVCKPPTLGWNSQLSLGYSLLFPLGTKSERQERQLPSTYHLTRFLGPSRNQCNIPYRGCSLLTASIERLRRYSSSGNSSSTMSQNDAEQFRTSKWASSWTTT